MKTPIVGLHHVTATVDDAQADLDFAAGTLGLRLVKQTVNFDNHLVFHFYYGDERGTPGTIWTTFPYKGHGVRDGSKGTSQIGATAFSVPLGSLEFWRTRLESQGIAVNERAPRFGEPSLVFADPSGLVIELIATSRDTRLPWAASPVPDHSAVRGIHSVTLHVATPGPTVEFMTSVLGYDVVNEMEGRIRVAVRGDAPGRAMDIAHSAHEPRGINGLGTVHHVAMAVPTSDDQLQMRAELVGRGVQVTPVMDRQYFTSIYFREPGGVLFEIATLPPGFSIDETPEGLGRELRLPPWEEPNRATIERGLPKVTLPR
jgi:glyoxalase family protein